MNVTVVSAVLPDEIDPIIIDVCSSFDSAKQSILTTGLSIVAVEDGKLDAMLDELERLWDEYGCLYTEGNGIDEYLKVERFDLK